MENEKDAFWSDCGALLSMDFVLIGGRGCMASTLPN
jgi:hypothetical protein